MAGRLPGLVSHGLGALRWQLPPPERAPLRPVLGGGFASALGVEHRLTSASPALHLLLGGHRSHCCPDHRAHK